MKSLINFNIMNFFQGNSRKNNYFGYDQVLENDNNNNNNKLIKYHVSNTFLKFISGIVLQYKDLNSDKIIFVINKPI